MSTLDGIGPWPPIQESHVEMDGAFALYEAWVKLQLGDVDTALVYCYGKSAPGPIHEVLSRQLDPYHVAPLWPDAISLAALQARALIDAGKATRGGLRRGRHPQPPQRAVDNPNAQLAWDRSIEDHLASSRYSSTRCARTTARRSPTARARSSSPPTTRPATLRERPAWIRGIDHRIEPMALGLRDLTTSASTRAAGREGRRHRDRSTSPSCTPRSATRS